MTEGTAFALVAPTRTGEHPMTMTRPRSRRLSGVALMATATALAVV